MALTKELLDNMYNILAEALDGDKEAFRDLLRLWKLEPFIREELSNQLAECLSRLYISKKVREDWKEEIWAKRHEVVNSYGEPEYWGEQIIRDKTISETFVEYFNEHYGGQWGKSISFGNFRNLEHTFPMGLRIFFVIVYAVALMICIYEFNLIQRDMSLPTLMVTLFFLVMTFIMLKFPLQRYFGKMQAESILRSYQI